MPQFQSSWVWVAVVTSVVLAALSASGYALTQMAPWLRCARGPAAFFCECLLLGVVSFSIAAFAGVLLGIEVHHVFYALLALAALITASSRMLRRGIRSQEGAVTAELAGRERRLSAASLVLIVAGSLLWSINNLRAFTPSLGGMVLVPWVDFLFHARQIGDFAHFGGDLGTLHPMLYGERLPLYHYGSYMVPALISYLGDIPSIQVATSVYPSVGMMLTGAAMLVLVSNSGAAAVLLATGLLFLLPDPSFWRPDASRQESFFFFQQVGVGGAYAVAVMGLALGHALQAFDQRSWAGCIVAVCLFSLAALFKVQIFVAYSLFFILFVIVNAPWRRARSMLACAVAWVLSFALIARHSGRLANAPTLELSTVGVKEYLYAMTNLVSTVDFPFGAKLALIPIAVLKLLAVTFGILVPIAALAAWKLRSEPSARTTIQLLLLSLASAVLVRLLVADNRGFGDVAEINGKTFVWPYFVVVYCTATLLWRCIASTRLQPRLRDRVLVACGIVLLPWAAVCADRLQTWPRVSETFARVAIPSGVAESAAYLNRHAGRRDVVQLCENDRYNALATLAERPVYVAKLMVNAPPETDTERRRFHVVSDIVRQADFEGASSRMTEAGISWLLMSPNCASAWERAATPVLTTGGYRLYKAGI